MKVDGNFIGCFCMFEKEVMTVREFKVSDVDLIVGPAEYKDLLVDVVDGED